jgi:WD40 repeat protein
VALGTNSKSLKICAIPNLNFDDEDELGDIASSGDQKLSILFENENHHNGSLYCIDWSRTSRLIASGSNDRTIKILVCPDLENQQNHQELLVLPLIGHSAIVRTVCFNPIDEFMLLSGGLSTILFFLYI